MRVPGRRDWKAIQWDYDWILAQTGDTCPYYLTRQEIQLILPILQFIGWSQRWKSDIGTPIDKDVIDALKGNLEYKLMADGDCEGDPCDDGCREYLPSVSFIEYFPNDPFRTPLHVPPGYSVPPWYNNPLIPLPGVLPTDAMVNGLAVIAPNLPLSGFPYARVHFSGEGELEIEFVQVPAGGLAIIDVDDDPTKITIVETSSDLIDTVGIAGVLAALGFDVEDANIVDTHIVEIHIDGEGDHFVDINFIPNVGGETLIGFGGGIRRISLCGLSEPGDFMPCCPEPTQQRYTDEGILEQSYDGGATYQERRDQDPRFNGPTLPPLTSSEGDIRRCEAANNVVGYLESAANQLIADGSAWSGLTALLSAIAGVVVFLLSVISAGALTPLLLGLTAALIAAGITAFEAAMTTAVYEELVCIVFCHCPEDGNFSEANWQSIKADILTNMTGIAATYLHDTINAFGPVGLINASRTGVAFGAECDECDCADEWCYVMDFTADDFDFVRVTSTGDNHGVWTTGVGWETTDAVNTMTTPDGAHRMAYIQLSGLAETVYTRILVEYDYVRGSFDSGALSGHFVALGGINKINIPFNEMVDGSGQQSEWNGSQGGTTSIQIWLRSSRDISSPYTYDGSATIKSIRLEGTGNNPFGTDNC